MKLIALTATAIAIFLAYHTFDQAVTVDHLQMAVESLQKREACLLRTSRAFVETINEADFRKWSKTHLGDLDIHDEERQMIINQVGFEFAPNSSITVE